MNVDFTSGFYCLRDWSSGKFFRWLHRKKLYLSFCIVYYIYLSAFTKMLELFQCGRGSGAFSFGYG